MYNDIALVKIDHPVDKNYFSSGIVAPIGLPESNYSEISKSASIAGYGVVLQQSLHTNGDGPEPYSQCASGAVYEGEHIEHWKLNSDG